MQKPPETVSRYGWPAMPPFHACKRPNWCVRRPLFVSSSMARMCQANRGEVSGQPKSVATMLSQIATWFIDAMWPIFARIVAMGLEQPFDTNNSCEGAKLVPK